MYITPKGTAQSSAAARVAPSQVIYGNEWQIPAWPKSHCWQHYRTMLLLKSRLGTAGACWPFTNSRDGTKGILPNLRTAISPFPPEECSSLCCLKGITQLPSHLLALLACAAAPCRRGASGRGCRGREWSWAEPREGPWAPAGPAAWWTLPPGTPASAWGQGTAGDSLWESRQDSQQPLPP